MKNNDALKQQLVDCIRMLEQSDIIDYNGHASHMAHGALLETLRIAATGYAMPGTVLAIGVLVPLTALDFGLNDLAEWQRDVAYPNRWSGLVGNATDTFPFHPALTTFDYNGWWHDQLLETRITGITARIKGLQERISALRAKRALLRAQLND